MGIDEQYEQQAYSDMEKDIKEGICPHCRRKGCLIVDEVDIGVGTLRRPPYCAECGWSMESAQEKALNQLMEGG